MTKGKMQRKGKPPVSLMLGSGGKEMQFFFSLEFGFLGFSHKHENKNCHRGHLKKNPIYKGRQLQYNLSKVHKKWLDVLCTCFIFENKLATLSCS